MIDRLLDGELAVHQSGDFPHHHAHDALVHIKSLFDKSIGELDNLSANDDQEDIDLLCNGLTMQIFKLFPLLGFIARSTEVRNAFEVHGPMLRVVRKVLGSEAKLIISSEWNYSPFTFLIPREYEMTDTVMIGMPASESDNALIVPLIGHELGHNIWRHNKLGNKFAQQVEQTVRDKIVSKHWPDFQKYTSLGRHDDLDDLVVRPTWRDARQWGLRQVEELFCDFVGIAIFGKSFLEAFSYLLAPGMPRKSGTYPTLKDRTKYHATVATSWSIDIPDGYEDRFSISSLPPKGLPGLLLGVADAAASSLVVDLAAEAKGLVEGKEIRLPSDDEVESVVDCFKKFVPPSAPPSLSAIVNATWVMHIGGMEDWKSNFPDLDSDTDGARRMLSELTYKSMEVLEISSRQGG